MALQKVHPITYAVLFQDFDILYVCLEPLKNHYIL